jgi:hypothetical protein
MKRELFEKIALLMQQEHLKSNNQNLPIKRTETEEVITYHFPINWPLNADERLRIARETFTLHGYKDLAAVKQALGEPEEDDRFFIRSSRPSAYTITRKNTTILYNKQKDKISLSSFEVGYKWSDQKKRFYPVRITTPLWCYSKHIYVFPKKGQVRYMKSTYIPEIACDLQIMQEVLGINFNPSLHVLTKYYVGASNDWDIIYNIHKTRIPKALKVFRPDQVLTLCDVLENHGELNKICQYLASNPNLEDDLAFDDHESLFEVVAMVMKMESSKSWLIRDWVLDHKALGKKLSLRVTSEKRIEDEHKKLSRERMLRGVKAVKVSEKYKDLFKDASNLNVEIVDNKARLIQESYEQDHCVATYANQINSGHCAIFSIPYNGQRYTLQVDQTYRNVQFKGLRNCEPPEELSTMVEDYLFQWRAKHPAIVAEAVEATLPF